MAKQKVSIGIIGGGMIADEHIKRIRKDNRGTVTWLAERSAPVLEDKLAGHRIRNGTLDYSEVLADPKVDAIVIATPPATHAAIAIEALRAGKHILLEKPMVHRRKELKRLLQEAARHPKQIILDCSCRHSRLQPKYRYIKNIIDSGELGEIYHIHHQHLVRTTFLDWNPKGIWARSKALAGGGPLLDWGVYDLSFHLGLLGDVPDKPRVHAFTRNGLKVARSPQLISDVEEHAAAFLQFDSGLTYYYERGAGAHLEAANETRISGTRGGLRFAYPTWETDNIELFHTNSRGKEIRELRKVGGRKQTDDHLVLTRHFIDCIEGRVTPVMPMSLAAKHLEILFKIFDAADLARKNSRHNRKPVSSPKPRSNSRKR